MANRGRQTGSAVREWHDRCCTHARMTPGFVADLVGSLFRRQAGIVTVKPVGNPAGYAAGYDVGATSITDGCRTA